MHVTPGAAVGIMDAMEPTSHTDAGATRSGDVVAVLAVKRLAEAKSRLAASRGRASDGLHRDLVLAMLLDTMDALRQAGVDRIVVISPDTKVLTAAHAAGATSVGEDRIAEPIGTDRLNQSFAEASALARRRWPTMRTVMLVQADLPAATAPSMRAVIDAARGLPQAVLTDRNGHGTTVLLRERGITEPPRFGPGSAAAHRATGAVELDPQHRRWPDLRTDVDTAADLDAAQSLGVGRHTAAVLDGARAPAPATNGSAQSETATKRLRATRDAS